MDEFRLLQVFRVRLPGRPAPVHLLHLLDGPHFDGFRGSESIAVLEGRILAAHSS